MKWVKIPTMVWYHYLRSFLCKGKKVQAEKITAIDTGSSLSPSFISSVLPPFYYMFCPFLSIDFSPTGSEHFQVLPYEKINK